MTMKILDLLLYIYLRRFFYVGFIKVFNIITDYRIFFKIYLNLTEFFYCLCYVVKFLEL